MLNDAELREIETAAAELVSSAGAILLRYFTGPLDVDYKVANNRSPVTDADRAADEYLRAEIARRFPSHGILTEETEGEDQAAEVMWVVDPLDGTTNFLNGLPIFAVLLGVLERGRPVAGAVFLPDIHRPEGRVLHARAGGGAYEGDKPLRLDGRPEPKRRMAAWPSYFLRMFGYGNGLRRRLGDVRSIGSAGYESALAATGVFDYVVFSRLWVWDLAAGLILVQEAGGKVVEFDRKRKEWTAFESFPGQTVALAGETPTQSELRKWRGVVVLGTPNAVDHVAAGLTVPSFRARAMRQKVTSWLRRDRRPAAGPPPQSQGQGRSRRE